MEQCERRVGREHSLIGEYVVEVTEIIELPNAIKQAEKLNKMVFDREGISDMFTVVKQENGYQVIRKLLGETDTELGDPISFINRTLLEKEIRYECRENICQ